MLLSRSDVVALLRCPRTGSSLRKLDEEMLVAENDETCRYQILAGCPIAIDFNNSIFDAEGIRVREAHSGVRRYSYFGLLAIVKKIVSPPKKVTAQNVAHILKLLHSRGGISRALVIGGGSIGQGMVPLYSDQSCQIVAFDVYASENVQFVADAHNIPLPDDHFDCVIIQAVLEHVLDPGGVVSEIYRVLKSDGLVYAETPFLQHVHEGAYDFTRFTDSGHRYLFRQFELLDSGASASAGTQLLWSLDYFFKSVFRSRAVGKVAKLLFFWVQYFDRIIPANYSVDSASGVFFLGRKQQEMLSQRAVISYYKGAQR